MPNASSSSSSSSSSSYSLPLNVLYYVSACVCVRVFFPVLHTLFPTAFISTPNHDNANVYKWTNFDFLSTISLIQHDLEINLTTTTQIHPFSAVYFYSSSTTPVYNIRTWLTHIANISDKSVFATSFSEMMQNSKFNNL
ncbi:conserved hypothetical protein [Trichinella spiralis]|uniref:hypothetical protein n=1 Tax=Trichinella spiralis TaxID=6334 RepID=UPI0001EFB65E|nr:conserved hypothetical protein [Trichinella spiralis]